jgi:glycosyltransferase involved in cell wall biosynthesis
MTYKRIQVCVLTYKRPDTLRSTLVSLQKQELQLPGVALHILVIDNDMSESGRQTFEEIFAGSPIPARYVVEQRQGIPHARNRALDESADMDFVAYIDDDEFADKYWVDRLVQAQAAYDADVVTGPVAPRYVKRCEWIIRGGFFERQKNKTGREVEYIATNNVLLRKGLATRFRFDLRFATTGGEDNFFFMQLKTLGAHMVWADDAIVYEIVSEERSTFRWLIRRAYSDANRLTKCVMQSAPGFETVAKRLSAACGGFLVGAVLLPTGLVGKHRAVHGLRLMCRAIGTIHALLGYTPVYYPSTNTTASAKQG